MDINHLAVWIGAVLSMVLGSIWYGPLFGKLWIKIIKATEMELEKRKEMQKAAMPLYFISFALTVLQLYLIEYFLPSSGVKTFLILWAAIVVPVTAGASMWNNDSYSISFSRFLVQSGYYLVLFILFGLVFSFFN